MGKRLDIVVLGLSLSSSWGNGHATTFRSLLRGLDDLGHRVVFLERDTPWYAATRDLPNPGFCQLRYYYGPEQLLSTHRQLIRHADAVMIGSYIPDGVQVIDAVLRLEPKLLAFYDIDTPVTLAKLRRGDEEYIARRQVPEFDVYFSFTGGPTLGRLEDEFGARRALALHCCVDESRYRNSGDPVEWDLGYIGTYSPDRQPALERLLLGPARLLPQMRFVVAGPQYPAEIDWPQNVERIEHLPPAEHPAFYSKQRFTLNITRADMIAAGWSPSVRLFEAAACGVPIISDYWRGLDDLFPDGEALLVARSTADVVAALREINEEKQHLIAENARTRVLARHTGRARARELVAGLAAAKNERAKPVAGMADRVRDNAEAV